MNNLMGNVMLLQQFGIWLQKGNRKREKKCVWWHAYRCMFKLLICLKHAAVTVILLLSKSLGCSTYCSNFAMFSKLKLIKTVWMCPIEDNMVTWGFSILPEDTSTPRWLQGSDPLIRRRPLPPEPRLSRVFREHKVLWLLFCFLFCLFIITYFRNNINNENILFGVFDFFLKLHNFIFV